MDVAPSSQQRKAVEAPLGPVLVVAGPGAGKTFCLIGRIEYLTTRLAPAPLAPARICAVTFTNKAADEIAERLHSVLGPDADEVRRGTIHALCSEILREHAAAAGLKTGFGIADEDYQRTVLRQIGQGRRSAQLLQLFGRHRLQGYQLTPGDEHVFGDYQRILRRRNMVDFDDLVLLTAVLFRDRPDVAGAVASRWDYLLVDEFQDVNAAQYDLLRRLAQPLGNIFAVGDDEQSIFSWTGADPRVLSRFQGDYRIAAPIVLERNHRSSQQIFAVARRLLDENPSLFTKDLTATRLSPYEVQALSFEDDDAEASWILDDIAKDREASAIGGGRTPGWGEYAVLYRRHEAGMRLERRFLRAGVPCRLARGRALADDRVIGPVIAALQLVLSPRDPAAAEGFARRVLPPHLFQRVEAEVSGAEPDFLVAVRDLAAGMPVGDPDGKKLWRFVYKVENLAAMRRKHETLSGLIEELLVERLEVFRNALEDVSEELTDPRDLPAAVDLADRLAVALANRTRVLLESANGLEIGLRGMLFAAGFKLASYAADVEQTELDDLRVGPDAAGAGGVAFTVFKALQLVHARALGGRLPRYVTFDLETTGRDTRSCEIVEIAAVRVVQGQPVDEFHSLVRPGVPVEAEARRKHGYGDTDLARAPAFTEVWPRFLAFVANDPLVAHNGQDFDVPVLRRMAAVLGSADRIQAYDTLPLARSLDSGSAKLTALAERFGVPVGRAHHALDDCRMLAGVFEELERRRLIRARKASLVNLLPYLGLSLALESGRMASAETDLLFNISRVRALGRFSDCLEYYEAERQAEGRRGPSLGEVIERLGGRARMASLREDRDAVSMYPEAVARLASIVEQEPAEPLDSAVTRFLERVALSASKEVEVAEHRVNLLTLHSTKGLEFSRVYVVGVEDTQMPGLLRTEEDPLHATQEARRLLYVGMTRAIDRLVLTRVDRRAGRPAGGSRFLEEMQLRIERPGQLPQPA